MTFVTGFVTGATTFVTGAVTCCDRRGHGLRDGCERVRKIESRRRCGSSVRHQQEQREHETGRAREEQPENTARNVAEMRTDHAELHAFRVEWFTSKPSAQQRRCHERAGSATERPGSRLRRTLPRRPTVQTSDCRRVPTKVRFVIRPATWPAVRAGLSLLMAFVERRCAERGQASWRWRWTGSSYIARRRSVPASAHR